MAYKQFPSDKYLKEVQQKLRLVEIEKPIIDKYYTEFRAKIKPTIAELPENLNESEIRNYVINELSPILKNQTINFVENLSKANDLMAFYKFGKAFLISVKDIRNLDSSFLADLWSKYKSKMLIASERQPVPKQKLTELFKNRLSPLETDLEQYPNKGNLNKSYNVEHLAHTQLEKQNISHFNELNTLLHKQEQQQQLKAQNKKNISHFNELNTFLHSQEQLEKQQQIYDKKQKNKMFKALKYAYGTKKNGQPAKKKGRPTKKENLQPSAAIVEGHGLHNTKFIGRGLPGITNYTRR